jgi:hypothetical protein
VIGDEPPFPKEWVERVAPKVRRDRPPFRPNGALVAVASVMAFLALVVAACGLFLIAGVLVQR